jgi:hypothetical protein
MKSAYENTVTKNPTNKYGLYEVPEGKWSGINPIPKIGDKVKINFNNLGSGIVVAYFILEGYIGVEVKLDKRPAWHIKQNGDTHPNPTVFGAELV